MKANYVTMLRCEHSWCNYAERAQLKTQMTLDCSALKPLRKTEHVNAEKWHELNAQRHNSHWMPSDEKHHQRDKMYGKLQKSSV